jgi:hypothetical protein
LNLPKYESDKKLNIDPMDLTNQQISEFGINYDSDRLKAFSPDKDRNKTPGRDR